MFFARDISRLSFRARIDSLPPCGGGPGWGFQRRIRSRRQVGERVDGHAGQVDLEVEVRSRGVPGAALVADDGVLVDLDAVTDGPAREVPVEGGKAPGVDDDHVAPVTAEPTAPAAAHREVVHDSSVGGVHRGAVVGCDVEAAMEVLAGAAGIVGLEWIGRAPESLGDDAVQWPLPLAGRARAEAFPNQAGNLRLQRGSLRLHLGQLSLELRLDGGDLLHARGTLVPYHLQLRLLILDLFDDLFLFGLLGFEVGLHRLNRGPFFLQLGELASVFANDVVEEEDTVHQVGEVRGGEDQLEATDLAALAHDADP